MLRSSPCQGSRPRPRARRLDALGHRPRVAAAARGRGHVPIGPSPAIGKERIPSSPASVPGDRSAAESAGFAASCQMPRRLPRPACRTTCGSGRYLPARRYATGDSTRGEGLPASIGASAPAGDSSTRRRGLSSGQYPTGSAPGRAREPEHRVNGIVVNKTVVNRFVDMTDSWRRWSSLHVHRLVIFGPAYTTYTGSPRRMGQEKCRRSAGWRTFPCQVHDRSFPGSSGWGNVNSRRKRLFSLSDESENNP